ncbi:MAG: hypothetical protein RLO18_17775, partial [Gimesia chilikensis]
ETFRGYLEHWQVDVELLSDYEATLEHCVSAAKNDATIDVVIFGPHWSREEILPIAREAQDMELATRFIFILDKTRRQKRMGREKLGIFLQANTLRRNDLYSAIAELVGRESPQAEVDTVSFNGQEKPQALSVDEARKQGTLILVAEDNAIN